MNRSSVCNNLYNHKLHNPLAVSRRYFGLYHNGFYIFDGFFILIFMHHASYVRGLLEKYPTFGREKETGLLEALDT